MSEQDKYYKWQIVLWINTENGKLYLMLRLLGGILPNTASEDLTKAYQILDVEKDLGNFPTSKLHRLLIAAFINYITVCFIVPPSHTLGSCFSLPPCQSLFFFFVLKQLSMIFYIEFGTKFSFVALKFFFWVFFLFFYFL